MEFYEYCRRLALYHGHKNNSGNMEYFDSFGCDFHIEYQITGETFHILITLGGVLYYEYHPSFESFLHRGVWKDLVTALYNYYMDDEPPNYSLLEICKREAKKNRDAIEKTVAYCRNIVKRLGKIVRADDQGPKYEYQAFCNGGLIKIEYDETKVPYLEQRSLCVVVSVDEKYRFFYSEGDLEIYCRYISGDWENALKKINDTLH